MFTDFGLYFGLGWQHILDLAGYDHILFIIVLCGSYLIKDWKKVLILVTAFTIGHSITLALSVLQKIRISSNIIEFLIPLTIVITAIINITGKSSAKNKKITYALALIFGLIHGIGFSNYLRSLLGRSSNITSELLAFNLGLEFGQLVIVSFILAASFIAINFFKVLSREWTLFLSSSAFGIALIMATERLSNL